MLTVTHHNRVWVLCLPAMGRPGLTGQDSIKRLLRGGRGGRALQVFTVRSRLSRSQSQSQSPAAILQCWVGTATPRHH